MATQIFEVSSTMAGTAFPKHSSNDITARDAATEPMQVTVVVPCYNEEEACSNFRDVLSNLRAEFAEQYQFFFVIVDDGSTDQTYEILRDAFAEEQSCVVIRHRWNQGVGAAIMTGIQHARTEVVCSMDFDCSYEPSQFSRMIPLLTNDVDVVTASPYHPDGLVRNVPHWRLALSKAASVMYSYLLTNKLFTYTSCFRVYRRSSVAEIELNNDGFVGVVELLWQVDRRGGRIVECPAELGVREYGQSKMRTLEVMFGHLKLMFSGIFRRNR